jgi:hypothetical protein
VTQLVLPATYEAADVASLHGQRNYLWLLRAQIVLPLAAAIAAVLWPGKEDAVAISILFLLALAASVGMQLWRPERVWFDGRVIAESVKTIAWRFAMRVRPYDTSLSSADARARVNGRVSEVVKERTEMAAKIGARAAGSAVTAAMETVRGLPWADRRTVYLAERLDDQLSWYKRRGVENDQLAGRWLTFVTLVQLVGLVVAVLRAAAFLEVNVFGLISGTIGAALAWLQAKRHQDLARSYGFAALELGVLQERVRNAATEAALEALVEQAEEAMSREHTAWAAKRL